MHAETYISMQASGTFPGPELNGPWKINVFVDIINLTIDILAAFLQNKAGGSL